MDFLTFKFNPEKGVRAHVEAVKLLSKQTKDAGGETSEEATINKIITSLPACYNNFQTSWESAPIDQRTLANLTTRLVNEEERNQWRTKEADKSSDSKALFMIPSTSQSSSTSDHQTPFPQSRGRWRGRGRGRRYNNRSTRFAASNQGAPRRQGECWHCGWYGHWEKECRNKKKEEDDVKAIEANAKIAQMKDGTRDVALIACASAQSGSDGDLYIDSGATQHISSQLKMLSNFASIEPGTKWIEGIGESRVEVLGKGDMCITALINGKIRSITFNDTLYAPDNGINLISVGAITSKGAEVIFSKTEVTVMLNGDKLIVGRRTNQSLYRLDTASSPSTAKVAYTPTTLQEWHQRLAHINHAIIIKTAESGAVVGLNLPVGTVPPEDHCHDCAVGKMKRSVFHKRTSPSSSHIGQLIHSDLCGPMQTKSLGGALYYVSFKDDYSGYRFVNYIQAKSDAANCFKEFVSLLHAQTGQLVACLRTDNGGEYEGLDFQEWLKRKGIRHETTVRYTPQQNGVSERDNRTLVEGARTILYSNKSLPLGLWAEAVNYVVYVLNRTLSSTRLTKTPYESWFNRKPDLSNLRMFGAEFYVLIPTELRRKLDPNGLLCNFIGNSHTQKGYRYYDQASGKVNTSRDVTPIHHHYEPRLPIVDQQKGVDVFPMRAEATEPGTSAIKDLTMNNRLGPQVGSNDGVSRSVRNRTQEEEEELGIVPTTKAPRRSKRERKPKRIVSMRANSTTEYEPDHYQDAMASEKGAEWAAAAKEEYSSLIKNNTWDLVLLPKNRSLIRCRWTFKIKPAHRETEVRRRARYVAKGYSQKPGVDYKESETYAPVVKHDSIRFLLSLAATLDLELVQLDVKTAFLYGDLDEELYIEQPEGFIQPGKENFVCRLKKPLYGLIQAARKWNEKFNSFLIEFGLVRSSADPCIYFHRGEDPDDITILGIWVDDGILATRTKEKAQSIIHHLRRHFEMTCKEADLFIGLEITRDRPGRKIHLSQPKYIQSLLDKFGMSDCHPSKVPADPNSRLTVDNCPGKHGKPLSTTPYRSAVGGLMYIAKMTRPDILFAVIAVSRYNQDPGKPHWEAVKRILSYLKGTMDHGPCYGRASQANLLLGYSDSDWAGCPDTRRSTSGLLFMLNGGPIAWNSHLQKPVAQSTAEAEYYAAGHASREILWLRNLLDELGFKQMKPTPLMCDNRSTTLMVLNPVFHDRTKHIEVKHHFIRQQYEAGRIRMVPVPSQEELADILTKPLSPTPFQLNRSRIGVLQAPRE